MSCCPTGSWPQLQSSYKAQGTVTSLDGIEIYSVGTPNPKCIIWNYDIFGFDSGRSRQMCDLFAAEGYFVIMPDYFRGDWMDPTAPTFTYPKMVEFVKRTTTWSGVLESDCKKVLSYAKQHGAERFGAVGTCWGSYPVVKMAAWDEVKCGVSIHPSHGMLSKVLEEDEREMLSAVKCPQLFMPTGMFSTRFNPQRHVEF